MTDHLQEIVARKRREIARRRPRIAEIQPVPELGRGVRALGALRRAAGEATRVIAEIKHRSPSAGGIRPREAGAVARIARGYADAGAAAVSVLADGAAFGGSICDVRRAAFAAGVPILFKEFVLDESQVRLAAAVSASMVLLLVRCLGDADLGALIDGTRALGMEPVVEAADEEELERALRTTATVIGVNARDLRSFEVDAAAAARAIATVPPERIAVLMSGIRTREDYRRLAGTRADAVLVGEALMRASDPGAELRSWLA
jgi:indole-3-glycerol phosphate synthase